MISYTEIHILVNRICGKIKREYRGVYGVPRGGLVPAALIAYKLGLPIVSFEKITRDILVVDDAVNSGQTMKFVMYADSDKVVLTVPKGKEKLVTYYGKIIKGTEQFPWEGLCAI